MTVPVRTSPTHSRNTTLQQFLSAEAGAVTTEFVVIVAVVVAIGMGAAVTVAQGTMDVADQTADNLASLVEDAGDSPDQPQTARERKQAEKAAARAERKAERQAARKAAREAARAQRQADRAAAKANN